MCSDDKSMYTYMKLNGYPDKIKEIACKSYLLNVLEK